MKDLIMYRTLCNNVYERSQITPYWILTHPIFDNDELNQLELYLNKHETTPGVVIGTDDKEKVEQIRKSNVKFFNKDSETGWIFKKFNDSIMDINDRYFNYNLFGYDSFQYTVYNDTNEGKYDWHMDSIHGPKTINDFRKLSVVMLLNRPNIDFEGGLFQINDKGEYSPSTIDLSRGRIVMFPSYFMHRVTPVTKGIRKSIVIWVMGPKFV